MINLGSAILQAQQQQEGNPIAMLLPLILLFLVFYFIFMRPQIKRQKELQAMIQSLKKGDKVVTSGGIIGTIVGVSEDKVTIKVGEGTKLEVVKSYIVQKLS
ncbi:preprotein translocase subunit YajC [bacterium]|nr:preprotein translocase subunit YajC [bacterium]